MVSWTILSGTCHACSPDLWTTGHSRRDLYIIFLMHSLCHQVFNLWCQMQPQFTPAAIQDMLKYLLSHMSIVFQYSWWVFAVFISSFCPTFLGLIVGSSQMKSYTFNLLEALIRLLSSFIGCFLLLFLHCLLIYHPCFQANPQSSSHARMPPTDLVWLMTCNHWLFCAWPY